MKTEVKVTIHHSNDGKTAIGVQVRTKSGDEFADPMICVRGLGRAVAYLDRVGYPDYKPGELMISARNEMDLAFGEAEKEIRSKRKLIPPRERLRRLFEKIFS